MALVESYDDHTQRKRDVYEQTTTLTPLFESHFII